MATKIVAKIEMAIITVALVILRSALVSAEYLVSRYSRRAGTWSSTSADAAADPAPESPTLVQQSA